MDHRAHIRFIDPQPERNRSHHNRFSPDIQRFLILLPPRRIHLAVIPDRREAPAREHSRGLFHALTVGAYRMTFRRLYVFHSAAPTGFVCAARTVAHMYRKFAG